MSLISYSEDLRQPITEISWTPSSRDRRLALHLANLIPEDEAFHSKDQLFYTSLDF